MWFWLHFLYLYKRKKYKHRFRFIEPRSQLNTTSTKPLLHGNIYHATEVFLFPFLSLTDIAFEEFRFFKAMYKLPELRIRQPAIIDTQPLAVKRSLQNPEVRVIFSGHFSEAQPFHHSNAVLLKACWSAPCFLSGITDNQRTLHRNLRQSCQFFQI